MSAGIDELLAAARRRIRRFAPADVPSGAVIIDIRSADARARDGVVPGALHIPRTVLEWRVDPSSEWRTPQLQGTEQLVLLCEHGYSSSLAAATLLELGIDAGDVIGGFEAWMEAGLPVEPAGESSPARLAGTGPPDSEMAAGDPPQTDRMIREAGRRLDDALEARDLDAVVACFDEECEVELLGVGLRGRAGVRRWLDWVFGQVESLRFEPRLTTVDGSALVEEFVVEATLPGGRRIRSRWAEVLDYRANLVRSLRLYFDPLDFLEAKGPLGRLAAPAARALARRGLEPFDP